MEACVRGRAADGGGNPGAFISEAFDTDFHQLLVHEHGDGIAFGGDDGAGVVGKRFDGQGSGRLRGTAGAQCQTCQEGGNGLESGWPVGGLHGG